LKSVFLVEKMTEKVYFSKPSGMRLTCDLPAGPVVDLRDSNKVRRAERVVSVVGSPQEQGDVEVSHRKR
jgi:hypothetical protein